jgi:hypothetical protein
MSFHQNNSGLGDFVDRIYPIELQIKDTTDTNRYFHTLTWTTARNGQGGFVMNEILRQKRRFQFSHCELSIYISNIPAVPAYVVCISQLIRYSRDCGSCQDFLDRGLLLTRKPLNQGFLFEGFTVLTLFTVMEYLCHKGQRICRKLFPVLSSFMTYHRVCN